MHQVAPGDKEYCFDCNQFCSQASKSSKCDCCKAHGLEKEARAELAEARTLEATHSARGNTTATEDEQFAAAQDDEGTGSAGSDSC